MLKYLLVLFILISPVFEDYVTVHMLPGDQLVTIVSFYEIIGDYLDRHAVFDEVALDAVMAAYNENCVPADINGSPPPPFPELYTMRNRYDEFRENIQHLRSLEVEPIILTALEAAAVALPGSDVTICVTPMLNPYNSRYMFIRDQMAGVSGWSGPDWIWLALDPQTVDWADWVAYTVAHEYHHHVALSAIPPGDLQTVLSLLRFVMLEGRADWFATMIYPEMEVPWTTALTADQEVALWERFQQINDSTNAQILTAWLYGDRNVPQWTAYTLGFNIMQAFAEHNPDVTVAEWTVMAPEEILVASSYNPIVASNEADE